MRFISVDCETVEKEGLRAIFNGTICMGKLTDLVTGAIDTRVGVTPVMECPRSRECKLSLMFQIGQKSVGVK